MVVLSLREAFGGFWASGKLAGSFREASGTPPEASGKLPEGLQEASGRRLGVREASGKSPGSFREASGKLPAGLQEASGRPQEKNTPFGGTPPLTPINKCVV